MKFAFNPLVGLITVSNAAFPCRVKIDAANFGQNVNADRLPAHTKERAALGEVGGG